MWGGDFCGERKEGGHQETTRPFCSSAIGQLRWALGSRWKVGLGVQPEEPRSKVPQMLQDPPMAVLRCVLLVLLAGLVPPARATEAPEVCEEEMTKIKDLLQVSCVEKGLTGLPAGLPNATGLLLLGSNRLGPRLSLAAFQPLAELTELDLSNNSLSALETGAPLPRLQLLALSHNALESLPDFRGLPALTRLALGHNALAQLPEGAFHALGALQDLQLQGNRLRHLPPGAFRGLRDLQDLDLSDNRLEALPRDLLAGLKALAILRLERNRLRTVPDGFFPEENTFGYVYLAGNPWRCDCRLAYLRAWILENELSVYTREQGAEKEVTENDPESVKCLMPAKEKGRPVMSFQADCRKLGDSDGGEGKGEGEETSESTPSTPLPPSFTPLIPITESSTRPATLSTHHPSTATSATPAAVAPTTAPPTPTVPRPFSTTASTTSTPSTPAAATSASTTLVPSTAALTTRVHTAASATPLAPVSRTTKSAPFSQEATTTPSTTFVPPTTAPLSTTTPRAGSTLITTAAVGSSTTRGDTPPGTSAPVSTESPAMQPTPGTPATCLCPAMPVQGHGATHRRQAPVTWSARLAHHCCSLRLALYLACLVLVVLPTLAALCCFGWVHLRWCRPASPGPPGAQGFRYRQLRAAGAQEPRARKPPIYRVCKTFHVAPLRHVSWLLVSLPCQAKREPWAWKAGSLSSYSLDRGRDTLGAVRVRYATSSL